MSESKEKKLKVYCTVCKAPLFLTKEQLRTESNFGEYILQAGTMTAIQRGNLCDSCLSKKFEERVVKK
jgi:hypothetical protein